LDDDSAISELFYHTLDPAVCIYECPHRVFRECANLPKQLYPEDLQILKEDDLEASVNEVDANDLWREMHDRSLKFTVVDVREPREYSRGHIPNATCVPLPMILNGDYKFELGGDHGIVFVCRSGRRSRRAVHRLQNGNKNIRILKGGMLSWEAAGLLEAVD